MKEKLTYVSPSVEILEIMVEQGFATSQAGSSTDGWGNGGEF